MHLSNSDQADGFGNRMCPTRSEANVVYNPEACLDLSNTSKLFQLMRALCKPCKDDIQIMFRLITRRVALAPRISKEPLKDHRGHTETILPDISPSLISLIRSSTPKASGRSFLFASTSRGTEASVGRARRACSSDVAVGRDFDCNNMNQYQSAFTAT
jgi:hypothetical protein